MLKAGNMLHREKCNELNRKRGYACGHAIGERLSCDAIRERMIGLWMLRLNWREIESS
jgi:hypothetical protein